MTTHILIDFNNLACRCVHIGQGTRDGWDLISYAIFSQIVNFLEGTMEFLDEGDKLDVVLALDSTTGYWRRDLYPPYKIDRIKKRSESDIDWSRAYEEFAKLTEAIAKFTPWKVLRVDKCEADDIIYALTIIDDSPSIIYSSDSDYLQLVSDSVLVYQPHKGAYAEFPMLCKFSGGEVLCNNTNEFLRYAILTGQGGKDNVYNVKTPADWVADETHKRKPGFGVKAAKPYVESDDIAGLLTRDGLLENYIRNRTLIDMSCLGRDFISAIQNEYSATSKNHVDMAGFLGVYAWPSMLSSPGEIQHKLMVYENGKESVENKPLNIEPVNLDFSVD